MSKLIADLIMNAQALFCVPQDWIGQTASEDMPFCFDVLLYWWTTF
jgi:hypothetical protein